MSRIILVLLTHLMVATLVFPQNAAVMIKEFTPKSVSPQDCAGVTEVFRNAVLGTKKFRIIEREGLQDILKEQELQLAGASDSKYAVAIGKIISVNYLLSGSVSKIGESYFLSVRLINVETAEIEDAWDANAQNVSGLGNAAKDLALKAGGVKTVAAVNTLSLKEYTAKTIESREDLEVVDLNDTKATDDDLIGKIRNPEKVRVLRLRNSLVTDRFMVNYFAKMINLEEINLANCRGFTEDGAMRGLSGINKLLVVNVEYCGQLGERVIDLLSEKNRMLIALHLVGIGASGRSFSQSLSRFSALKKISYDGFSGRMSDAAVATLVAALPDLEYISLGRNALTDISVDSMIEKLKAPKFIYLTGNAISDGAVDRLKKRFPACSVLCEYELRYEGSSVTDDFINGHLDEIRRAQVLKLSATGITDAGAVAIFKNAEKLTALLVGRAYGLTDQCLENGARYLKKCKTFGFMNCTGIGDRGVCALIDNVSTLYNIELGGTAVTQEGIDYIKKKFPNCKIVY